MTLFRIGLSDTQSLFREVDQLMEYGIERWIHMKGSTGLGIRAIVNGELKRNGGRFYGV